MMTMLDVQQLLKKFGTIIYTGNRDGDIELMIEEIRELHKVKLLDTTLYREAMLILQNEKRKVNDKGETTIWRKNGM